MECFRNPITLFYVGKMQSSRTIFTAYASKYPVARYKGALNNNNNINKNPLSKMRMRMMMRSFSTELFNNKNSNREWAWLSKAAAGTVLKVLLPSPYPYSDCRLRRGGGGHLYLHLQTACARSAGSLGTDGGGGHGDNGSGRTPVDGSGGGGDGSESRGEGTCQSVVTEPQPEDATSTAPSVIVLDVGGMSCGSCATSVKHILEGQVIRLSSATQDLPKSVVCNVHGVNPKFLEIGQRKVTEKEQGLKSFPKGAYYIGKMLWGKGYRELLDLLAMHKNDLEGFQVDVFGNGEDSKEVQETAHKLGLAINFNPGIDHADESLHGYKMFINPSVSDVVCTTTAEALAMGKIVVCANHPSNEFFRSFPNCLTYRDPKEFVEKVKQAMSTEPLPLTSDQQYILSWEAATDRFISCSGLDDFTGRDGEHLPVVPSSGKGTMPLSMSIANLKQYVEDGLAFTHYLATGIEAARLAFGAIPGSLYPDEEQCRDLGLIPPVKRPVHGWFTSRVKCLDYKQQQ